jgi:hypothetical protein
MSSSLDSGSDHSDVSMEPSVKSPLPLDREIEKQPDLPDDWKPPSRFSVWLCFTAICYFSVGKPNLEQLWQEVREEGWKKRNERFRTVVWTSLCMVSILLIIFLSCKIDVSAFLARIGLILVYPSHFETTSD